MERRHIRWLVFWSQVFILHMCHPVSFAQLSFADSSKLKDRRYLEDRIKNITDADLFTSLTLSLPGLQDVRRRADAKDYKNAFAAWSAYWNDKPQPKYITQTYRLLIDTEMLTSYDDARRYAAVYPEERDSTLERASMILRHEIRTWGDRVETFGKVIDFNREMGHSGKYGFHYWIWARPLNTAFVLTGDQKYLAEFDNLFQQWYEQRNTTTRGFPDLDVVYYELGLGIRNRMFIEYYLLPYEGRGTQTHEKMLKTILGAARWLYELQKWEGYRPGNWQIHGAFMLAQIALTFPEFTEAAGWRAIALQRLEEHMDRDFFEDGGHSERAPRNYTQATYLGYRNLYYLLTAHTMREDLAAKIRRSMGKTIDWWITMVAPTGEIPAINDSHRGLFPVRILRDGAEFFGKPEAFGVLKNMFGVQTDHATALPSYTSRHMPASGFTVMRSDWSRDALYMSVNYGKFSGFHTHNDMLDFEIYAYGKALAVDAGIGLNYDDSLYIPWYQSSRSHNMVVVNDRNIERKEIEGRNVTWSSTASFEYFSGEHRGYAALGVSHRRQIVFVRPEYWFVLDHVTSQKAGDTLSWYFHSPTQLISHKTGFRSSTSPGIIVLPASAGLTIARGEGYAASTTSETPGNVQLINWNRFDQVSTSKSFRQFPILLLPFKDRMPDVSSEKKSDNEFLVQTEAQSDHLYFPNGRFDNGEVATDAQFLWVRFFSGRPVRFGIAQGTYLRYKGKELWRSSSPTSADGRIPP